MHTLKIDAREIFNPKMQRESPELYRIRALIESCSKEEAAALVPFIESILNFMRSKDQL